VNARGGAGSWLVMAGGLLVAAAGAACSPQRPRLDGSLLDAAAAGVRQAPAPPRAAQGAGGAPPSVPVGAAARLPPTKTRQPPPGTARATEDSAAVDLVTIHVLVEPPQRAHVIWGAKDFGLAPLDIRRPRGSGPLDLVVRAPGYLTLHTRAFTDRDNTLSVRLVTEAEAPRFAGYRAPAAPSPAHAPAVAAARRTTARAMRPGKPAVTAAPPLDTSSDGAGAP